MTKHDELKLLVVLRPGTQQDELDRPTQGEIEERREQWRPPPLYGRPQTLREETVQARLPRPMIGFTHPTGWYRVVTGYW